jgi:hypothetical protein
VLRVRLNLPSLLIGGIQPPFPPIRRDTGRLLGVPPRKGSAAFAPPNIGGVSEGRGGFAPPNIGGVSEGRGGFAPPNIGGVSEGRGGFTALRFANASTSLAKITVSVSIFISTLTQY